MNCLGCSSTIYPVYERKPDGLLKCTYNCGCGSPNPGVEETNLEAASDRFSEFIDFLDSWNGAEDDFE